MTPQKAGKTIISLLPNVPGDRMTTQDKLFWIKVAEELGPDFIQELKRAVDFMNEVDNY